MTPNPRYWPIADVAAIEINAMLLTFKGRDEQRVWMCHIGKLADRNGSEAVSVFLVLTGRDNRSQVVRETLQYLDKKL